VTVEVNADRSAHLTYTAAVVSTGESLKEKLGNKIRLQNNCDILKRYFTSIEARALRSDLGLVFFLCMV
jgi:hypothetical protein